MRDNAQSTKSINLEEDEDVQSVGLNLDSQSNSHNSSILQQIDKIEKAYIDPANDKKPKPKSNSFEVSLSTNIA
jgi:hypothetical protein